jgi:hypothetical protein
MGVRVPEFHYSWSYIRKGTQKTRKMSKQHERDFTKVNDSKINKSVEPDLVTKLSEVGLTKAQIGLVTSSGVRSLYSLWIRFQTSVDGDAFLTRLGLPCDQDWNHSLLLLVTSIKPTRSMAFDAVADTRDLDIGDALEKVSARHLKL